MKKPLLIPALVVATVIAATITFAEETSDFLDVFAPNEYIDAINYVKAEGIVEGYEDGTYRPNKKINRAEFTKIIVEAVSEGEVHGENCFPDISNEWFAKYVCSAKASGLIGGYPDGEFKPSQNISFVEASKIIVLGFGGTAVVDDPWYRPFVQSLGSSHAIPYSINRFSKEITRGDMAEIIFRLKGNITDKGGLKYSDLVGIKSIWTQADNGAGEELVKDFIEALKSSDIHEPEEAPEEVEEEYTSPTVNFTSNCEVIDNLVLTADFVDKTKLWGIIPLGHVGYTGTSYNSRVSPKERVAVYAPHDSVLDEGFQSTNNYDGEENISFSVRFRIGCNYTYRFDGLSSVSDPILEQIEGRTYDNSYNTYTQVADPITIKAGDIIGYNNDQFPFSFSFANENKQVDFVNVGRYASTIPHELTADCPFDYYAEDMRKEYFDLFTDTTGEKATLTECPSSSQDLSGTASGNWFSSPHTATSQNPSSTRISVALDHGENSVIIGQGPKGNFYINKGSPSYKKPTEITGFHCYTNIYDNQIAYIEVLPNDEMDFLIVENSTSCKLSMPSGATRLYR